MTIVFPRPMPLTGIGQQLYDIQRVDFAAPEAGGTMGGVQAGFPLWIATWTTARNSRDVSDEWIAWLSTMRGSQKRFLGRDYARSFPRSCPGGFDGLLRAGGGAFDGSASSWSETIDSAGTAYLTLRGLPAGLVLSLTDLIGFRWDAGGAAAKSWGRRTVARVVEAGIASAAGTVTVAIEPPLPYFIPATAQAHLNYPACVMTVVPQDTKVAPIDRRLVATGTVLAGVQDLRP
jgi:hypothetical protein